MKKRTNRFYTAEFKQEAVALVTEQGYSLPKAADLKNCLHFAISPI
ncbi:transposase [Providencia rettgeri]|nr:transposase [Providencia rettgeri]MBO3023255.1 transposase [Providencia rettgeri]